MACRVELRDLPPNATWHERQDAFKKMHSIFKKRVAEAGILHDYKLHEYYESPGDKKRRKRKESRNRQLSAKLRENFPVKEYNRGTRNE